MKTKMNYWTILTIVFPMLATLVLADVEVIRPAINNGGGTATSPAYAVNATIGQNAVAMATSATYFVHGGIWFAAAPMPCAVSTECALLDANACTFDSCEGGFCEFAPVRFGNVNGDAGDLVNLDDILCLLSGFANFALCPNGDLDPCSGNDVINLDDILRVLAAFSGVDPCGCQP